MENNHMEMKVCKCPHHKVVPVAIILIGLAFLLQTWDILTMGAVAVIWPVLLIVIGAVKLGGCKCCKENHQGAKWS
ncbi:MAG: DUF5668 domain-containing protein [bacterium]